MSGDRLSSEIEQRKSVQHSVPVASTRSFANRLLSTGSGRERRKSLTSEATRCASTRSPSSIGYPARETNGGTSPTLIHFISQCVQLRLRRRFTENSLSLQSFRRFQISKALGEERQHKVLWLLTFNQRLERHGKDLFLQIRITTIQFNIHSHETKHSNPHSRTYTVTQGSRQLASAAVATGELELNFLLLLRLLGQPQALWALTAQLQLLVVRQLELEIRK